MCLRCPRPIKVKPSSAITAKGMNCPFAYAIIRNLRRRKAKADDICRGSKIGTFHEIFVALYLCEKLTIAFQPKGINILLICWSGDLDEPSLLGH